MRLISIFVISLFIVGCQNGQLGRESNDHKPLSTEPIHYEKGEDPNEQLDTHNSPMKPYLQSDEKGIGKDGTERNIFETDEALEIAQKLSLRDDVKQTQVATTDDQVAVFVLLRDYQNPQIAKSIEQDIRAITPNKEIFVYTDKIHWNRLKDLDSSMRARKIGNDLEKFLEENFNIEIKD